MKKTRKNAIFFSWEMYMVLEMDIVSSRYYAYVNGTYNVQQTNWIEPHTGPGSTI